MRSLPQRGRVRLFNRGLESGAANSAFGPPLSRFFSCSSMLLFVAAAAFP